MPFTLLDTGATLAPGPLNGIGTLTIMDSVRYRDCATYAVKKSATGKATASSSLPAAPVPVMPILSDWFAFDVADRKLSLQLASIRSCPRRAD